MSSTDSDYAPLPRRSEVALLRRKPREPFSFAAVAAAARYRREHGLSHTFNRVTYEGALELDRPLTLSPPSPPASVKPSFDRSLESLPTIPIPRTPPFQTVKRPATPAFNAMTFDASDLEMSPRMSVSQIKRVNASQLLKANEALESITSPAPVTPPSSNSPLSNQDPFSSPRKSNLVFDTVEPHQTPIKASNHASIHEPIKKAPRVKTSNHASIHEPINTAPRYSAKEDLRRLEREAGYSDSSDSGFPDKDAEIDNGNLIDAKLKKVQMGIRESAAGVKKLAAAVSVEKDDPLCIRVRVPKLWRGGGSNWKFTWLGALLASVLTWLILETVACSAVCRSSALSTGRSWSVHDPEFPFAIPFVVSGGLITGFPSWMLSEDKRGGSAPDWLDGRTVAVGIVRNISSINIGGDELLE